MKVHLEQKRIKLDKVLRSESSVTTVCLIVFINTDEVMRCKGLTLIDLSDIYGMIIV